MRPSFLIVDHMHESIVPMLSEAGFNAVHHPDISAAEVLERISAYEGLIVRSKIPVDRALIDRADKLRFVARAGAGVDQVDLDLLAKRNIELINAPEGNADALAEHTIGMMLGLLNRLNIADKQIRQGIWDREGNRGYELQSKTIGLLGYGFMAKAVAKRLKAFGCEVIAHDRDPSKSFDDNATRVSLEELMDRTQVLSIHIPLDAHNRGLVNDAFLAGFRNPIWLFNTARGEVLNTNDLVKHLKAGKVIGAGLDVLENEKLDKLTTQQAEVFEELKRSEKVFLSPHVAGWSFESYVRINQVLVKKIKALYTF